MNNFWTKLKAWWQPKPKKKLIKTTIQPKASKLIPSINYQHYHQLISKLSREAIAIQRARKKRRSAC